MRTIIFTCFTAFTLLTGVTAASAGIGEMNTEIGFKYPTDLVEFKYPEFVEFEYPRTLDK